MIITKIKNFLKSFRNKVILIISLIVVVSVLLISKYVLKNDTETEKNETFLTTDSGNVSNISGKYDPEKLRAELSPGIDSVLRNFGIKNEWISNSGEEKLLKKGTKQVNREADLFVKNVLIPNELSSIEVNADLSSYLRSLGLKSTVNEDILTKNIIITVNADDTLQGKLPLAKINIDHSDKVKRESAIICVIINNINEFEPEDIDKLLLNKNEFSYVFPRNLDDIDLQNKLMHSKKDIIINMTAGGRENYETDFNASMDEKAIHERVKSFSSDYPTVTTVLLTKKDSDLPPQFMGIIASDFANYKIKVISDNDLTKLIPKADEDSKNKFILFASNIKSKAALSKSIITTISVDKDDLETFYDEILILKKLGYKFYNYSDFASRKEEFEKQEQMKQEKAKEEKQKLDELKKINDKKLADKKKQQDKKKTVNKKTDTKKQDTKSTDKKKTQTKKTEPKKKTDVKKKK